MNNEEINNLICTLENHHISSKPIFDLQKEIYKKDKIINLMTEQLAGLTIWNIKKDEPLILGSKEEVKEYFTKQVEGEKDGRN